MEKAKNSSVWTKVGYTLFAEEGMQGIQVERLARILQLNKSGFYHYFGDVDGYFEELIQLHRDKAAVYLTDLKEIKNIDPDYLLHIVKHKVAIMFHLQLIRNKDNKIFYETAAKIDKEEDQILGTLWSDYLGIHQNPDLAIRYFNVVRDMFYARISLQNMEYPFLHKLMAEAKVVMRQIAEAKDLKLIEP